MYNLLFNEEGKLKAIYPIELTPAGAVIFESPLGFDPLKHTAILEQGEIYLQDRPVIIPSMNPIEKDIQLYPERRAAGLRYSDQMNARLNNLTTNYFTPSELSAAKTDLGVLTDLEVLEAAKDDIDSRLSSIQFFIEGGKWKSAHREVSKMLPGGFLKAETLDEIKDYINNFVLTNYE